MILGLIRYNHQNKTNTATKHKKREKFKLRRNKIMTTIIAKIFIIMTLVFEVITIAAGSALYPVFAAACGIIFGCVTIQLIIGQVRRISSRSKVARRMFLVG